MPDMFEMYFYIKDHGTQWEIKADDPNSYPPPKNFFGDSAFYNVYRNGVWWTSISRGDVLKIRQLLLEVTRRLPRDCEYED
jgi:hypothetical protein